MIGNETSLEGQVLEDRYVIEALVHRGASFDLYRAKQISLARTVALKILRPETTPKDSDVLERLKKEILGLARLDHNGIPHVIDSGTRDGCPWLIREFVAGKTLEETFGGNRSHVVAKAVVNLLLPIAQALVGAHRAGIIHRNLKPANVILNRSEQVRLVDFGFAALHVPGAYDAAYAAPEQRRGELGDHRSDLWALGAIGYRMIAGRVVDGGMLIDGRQPPRPSWLVDAAKSSPRFARLADIVDQLLATDREARFATAHQAVEALRALQHELETQPAGAVSAIPVPAQEEHTPILAMPADEDETGMTDPGPEIISEVAAPEIITAPMSPQPVEETTEPKMAAPSPPPAASAPSTATAAQRARRMRDEDPTLVPNGGRPMRTQRDQRLIRYGIFAAAMLLVFVSALTQCGGDEQELVEEARALIDKGDASAAASLLAPHKEKSTSAALHAALARAYYETGRDAEAITGFITAARADVNQLDIGDIEALVDLLADTEAAGEALRAAGARAIVPLRATFTSADVELEHKKRVADVLRALGENVDVAPPPSPARTRRK